MRPVKDIYYTIFVVILSITVSFTHARNSPVTLPYPQYDPSSLYTNYTTLYNQGSTIFFYQDATVTLTGGWSNPQAQNVILSGWVSRAVQGGASLVYGSVSQQGVGWVQQTYDPFTNPNPKVEIVFGSHTRTTSYSLAANEWHLLTVITESTSTPNKTNIYLYVDTVVQWSGSITVSGSLFTPSAQIVFGGLGSSWMEVQFINGTRSNLPTYSQLLPDKLPNSTTLGLWQFNEIHLSDGSTDPEINSVQSYGSTTLPSSNIIAYDINECPKHPCASGKHCVNMPSSFSCQNSDYRAPYFDFGTPNVLAPTEGGRVTVLGYNFGDYRQYYVDVLAPHEVIVVKITLQNGTEYHCPNILVLTPGYYDISNFPEDSFQMLSCDAPAGFGINNTVKVCTHKGCATSTGFGYQSSNTPTNNTLLYGSYLNLAETSISEGASLEMSSVALTGIMSTTYSLWLYWNGEADQFSYFAVGEIASGNGFTILVEPETGTLGIATPCTGNSTLACPFKTMAKRGCKRSEFLTFDYYSERTIFFPYQVPVQEWVFISVVVGDDGYFYLYQDAEFIARSQRNVSTTLLNTPTGGLNFFGDFLVGEIQVWNAIRTAADLSSDMVPKSLSNGASGLVVYSRFSNSASGGSTVTNYATAGTADWDWTCSETSTYGHFNPCETDAAYNSTIYSTTFCHSGEYCQYINSGSFNCVNFKPHLPAYGYANTPFSHFSAWLYGDHLVGYNSHPVVKVYIGTNHSQSHECHVDFGIAGIEGDVYQSQDKIFIQCFGAHPSWNVTKVENKYNTTLYSLGRLGYEPQGIPTISTPQFTGYTFYLNGTQSTGYTIEDAGTDYGFPVTLSAWIKRVAKHTETHFYNGDPKASGFGFFHNSVTDYLDILVGGFALIHTSYRAPVNEWLFISVEFDNNNEVLLYVNGQFVDRFGADFLHPFKLHVPSTPFGQIFISDGAFAELQIWHEARTSYDINTYDLNLLAGDLPQFSTLDTYIRFSESGDQEPVHGIFTKTDPTMYFEGTFEFFDVDECADNSNICIDTWRFCGNTVGSYICRGPWVTSSSIPTTHGGVVTIWGEEFGPAGTTYLTSITGPFGPCTNATVTVAETEIQCNMPSGYGALITLQIVMFANNITWDKFAYEAPVINEPSVSPINTNGDVLTIFGSNFYFNTTPNSYLKVGFANPIFSSLTIINDTTAYGTIQPGVGHFEFAVSIAAQESGFYQYSYGLPVIQTFEPTNPLTSGGEVTITGLNFGGDAQLQLLDNAVRRILLNGPQGVTECDRVLIKPGSPDSLVCNLWQAYGTNISLTFTVGTGNNTLTSAPFYFDFSIPVIESLHYEDRVFALNHVLGLGTFDAGHHVTINGNNFGKVGTPLTVVIGSGPFFECTDATVIIPHTQIRCVLPMFVGKNLPIQVHWGTEQLYHVPDLPTVLFSSKTPIIHQIRPTVHLDTLGQAITIFGLNFGPASLPSPIPRKVMIDGVYECTNATTSNGFELVCNFPAGTGVSTREVSVQVGTDTVTFKQTFEYHIPVVDGVLPNYEVRTGSKLTIVGRYFGGNTLGASRLIKIGDNHCGNIQLISDTTIVCTVRGGAGVGQFVSVTVSSQTNDPLSKSVDFLDVVTPRLDCIPPQGSQDGYAGELCNCWSGFAPSDESFGDCSVRAQCPGMLADTFAMAGGHGALRPTTLFDNDMVKITQLIPITKNRRTTNIKFVSPHTGFPGAPTCNYPGSLWTKTVSNLDCVDSFNAQMPWTQHELCGWAKGTNLTVDDAQTSTLYDIYKVLMITTYTEAHIVDGQKYERVISSSFLLSIQFAKHLEALLTSEGRGMFQVAVAAELLDVDVTAYVVGDSLFEPSSGSVFVTFRTSVQWPFAIDPVFQSQGVWVPSYTTNGTVNIITQQDVHQPFGIWCDSEHSECMQQWVSTIQIGSGDACVTDLSGIFSFTGAVICRNSDSGVGACQNPTTVTFHIRSETTDLCDNPDFTTDVTSGSVYSLLAFSDPAFSSQTSSFQTGDTAYFSFTVTTPYISIDKIEFTSIVIRAQGSTTTSDTLLAGSTAHPGVNFQYKNLETQVHPGNPGVLTFSFSLIRSALDTVGLLSVSNGPSGLIQTLSIEAVIDIFYHGNGNDGESRKRSVQVITPLNPVTTNEGKESNIRTASDRVQIHVRPSQSDLKKMTFQQQKRGEMETEEDNIFASLEGKSSASLSSIISVTALLIVLFGSMLL